ncbi:MAG: hypothetical protein AB1416_14340 [Actinomycetota bacterium]
MPRFEVRLESTRDFRPDGSPHYRVTRLVADTQDDAAEACRRMEFRRCAYQLPPTELARIEAIEEDPTLQLRGAEKGRLHAHRQTEPYTVVSVTEIPGRDEEGGE